MQHHCEPDGFSASIKLKDCQPKVRPTPEGAGKTRGDPHRNMCQRADAVPSYKSLPGAIGDRIRSTMSFGSGTICRGTMSAYPGFGRSDGKVACCEKCSATLVALKKQALSLAVHHQFSCKVSNRDALMELLRDVVDHKCTYRRTMLLTFKLIQILMRKQIAYF